MKALFLLLFALFLSIGTTSCTPDEITDTPTEQEDSFAGDPNSEEAEEDIDPND